VLVAEFTAEGRSTDPDMPGATGTLTLYVDDAPVGSGTITTQPGYFCLTGGTIDKVVVECRATGTSTTRRRSVAGSSSTEPAAVRTSGPRRRRLR
jgi:hypothetical protein